MSADTQHQSKQTQQAQKPAATPRKRQQAQKPAATLAQKATQQRAAKRKPVFRDVSGIPRVPLSDGRVGCVQAEVILLADGTVGSGAHMLTIPRRNADGSEAGQRFPLSDVQLLADAFAAAGYKLV